MDITALIPTFGNIAFTLGAFIIALSIIVAVHEFGHYIVGRWSGIDADVFSLGFGPVLLRRRDRRGTVWQVAAIPLGGYVRFRGDSDAASVGRTDEDQAPEELRRTMHGAPLWARTATVAAGPAFNFALSIAVFAAVMMLRGVASDPLTVDEVMPLPYDRQELQAGDRLLAIDGRETPPFEEFDSFIEELPAAREMTYSVRRDGTERDVVAPFPYPPLAQGVSPNSAASTAGIEAGDVILSVDGEPIAAFRELRDKVGDSEGRTLVVEIWRPDGAGGGSVTEVALVPRSVDLPMGEGRFETRWMIGISGGLFFEPAAQTPGVFEALSYGVGQTIFIVESSLSGLYHMAVGAISSCNLSGPIGIAETSGQAASQGWMSFVWFVAVLSTAVGLLNLFPIPILDGGHLVFHAYEAVAGRPPSDLALRIMMAFGLAVLATLMVFAVTNDLFCP